MNKHFALCTLLIPMTLALATCGTRDYQQPPARDFSCVDTAGRTTFFVTANTAFMNVSANDSREEWSLTLGGGWPVKHTTQPNEHCGFLRNPP